MTKSRTLGRIIFALGAVYDLAASNKSDIASLRDEVAAGHAKMADLEAELAELADLKGDAATNTTSLDRIETALGSVQTATTEPDGADDQAGQDGAATALADSIATASTMNPATGLPASSFPGSA